MNAQHTRTQLTHNIKKETHRDTWEHTWNVEHTKTQLTNFRRPSFSEPAPSAQQQQHAEAQPTGELSYALR